MENKKNIWLIMIMILAIILVALYFLIFRQPQEKITSFEQCVAAGNPVMESYPRQCQDKQGNIFKEEVKPIENDKPICEDLCGDGECQEIVCQGSGCPCAETKQNCAADCNNNAGLANPASVYCEENNGHLIMRDDQGGQIGICQFDDGSECEEWMFMRGECKKGEFMTEDFK